MRSLEPWRLSFAREYAERGAFRTVAYAVSRARTVIGNPSRGEIVGICR